MWSVIKYVYICFLSWFLLFRLAGIKLCHVRSSCVCYDVCYVAYYVVCYVVYNVVYL